MDIEGLLDFATNIFKPARLVAIAGGLGIAMHRIADPQHAAAFTLHRLQQRRQLASNLACAHAMNQPQAPRLIVRVQHIHHAQQLIRGDRWPHLHRHGVVDATEIFDMRAFQRRRAHTDPREMGGQVEPTIRTRHPPRLRLFVGQ